MFYETSKNNHGLKYNQFKSCIIPRPIAWITTLTQDGIDNCAPYSFFNGVASDPPMVMFANNGPAPDKNGAKDTFSNIKVNKAKILLPVLSTLVAPIFPDPIFLTSFFKKNLVNIKPKGIDPIKYAQKDKIIISIFKF